MTNNILLVDDEEIIRNLYTEFFEMKDCQVRTAKTGEECINMLKGYEPDVVILDIKMPGIDGIETLKLIKNDEDLKKIPVVMLTAVNEVESIKECLSLGAIGYVVKINKPEHVFYQLQLFLKAIQSEKEGYNDNPPLRLVN
ncbi:MAG: response regulator [Candidatus Dadabacteria bacterium]|nr:response regulator [Candidatus Dadabacteria bacterium]NIQ15275.1 response regulator [Candidatus Dadabacteria bacterium]